MRTRRTVAGFGVLVAAVLGLSACASGSFPALGIEQTLRAVGTSADHSVVLGDVYGESVEFDRVIVVCPYDTPEALNEALGSDWSLAGEVAPPVRDSEGALVLAEGATVHGVIAYSRSSIDFCAADAALPVDATSSVLPSFGADVPLVFVRSADGAWVPVSA